MMVNHFCTATNDSTTSLDTMHVLEVSARLPVLTHKFFGRKHVGKVSLPWSLG